MTSAPPRRPLNEARDVRRPVLQVAVHQQDVAEAAAAHGARPLRTATPLPRFTACRTTSAPAASAAAAVSSVDPSSTTITVVDVRPRPEHHLADVRALVERRDHRDDAQRLGAIMGAA